LVAMENLMSAVKPGDGDEILVGCHVGKTFVDSDSGDEVEAFRDVSLTVNRREFVCLVGPSGCGKSTLLRIIAGLERPTSGEILVAGQRVAGPGADRGMVFQEYALFPWKTTQANVEFGLRLKGIEKGERARIARRFIQLVGLNGFENKFPHQLSGGMRQRAAVARALANEPAVLLMDEPFAAVDAMTRQRLQEELTSIIQAAHITVIFVTHSIEEAAFLGDRVIVLSGRPGRVVSDLRIDIERPRRWSAVTNDAKFAGYKNELTQLIQGAHTLVGDPV
jgi:NitT/TauT family transport system ATP-binding protein